MFGRGLLQRTPTGYAGGAGLVERGNRAAGQSALRPVVIPELAELQRRTGVAVWMVDVSSAAEWVLVGSIYDRIAAHTQYSDDWPRRPQDPAVLASALGAVALADEPAAVDKLLRRGVPRLTPHTAIEPIRALAALHRAKDAGALIEHGRFRLGWSCVAVPVMHTVEHRTVGVVGAVDRTPRFMADRLLRATQATAALMEAGWPRPVVSR
ncbi:MAG: IclR family transcriptional regulator C-terminal domain-containing protein [Micropruina sp.]